MATRIVINQVSIEEDEGHKPQQFVVSEPFDVVLDRVMPINAPSSVLEMRTRRIYHAFDDGRRMLIHEDHIEWWEEVSEEEEDDE